MGKRIILVTGTPAVGKTSLAKKLAEKLKAEYTNLTELAKREQLILSEDKARNTAVVDETKMRRKLRSIIRKAAKDVVVDGHYAAAVTPKALTTHIFVLRRHPVELREFMKQRGYSEAKQKENLEAEILDVCLVEALQKQEKQRVCELNVSRKTVEEVLGDVVDVLEGKKQCSVGCVDWMSTLEREGTLSEYLKP